MTTFQGLSAAAGEFRSRPMKCATAGLKEGAVVIFDTSVSGGQCKAPTGTGNTGVAGVIVGQQPDAGTAAGDTVEVAYWGTVPVQLKAGQSVNEGDNLMTNGTDGSTQAAGSQDSTDYVARSLVKRTAGANNELITAFVNVQFVGTVP